MSETRLQSGDADKLSAVGQGTEVEHGMIDRQGVVIAEYGGASICPRAQMLAELNGLIPGAESASWMGTREFQSKEQGQMSAAKKEMTQGAPQWCPDVELESYN